jgi:hypothetical protein
MVPSNKAIARILADAPKIVSATVALMEELVRVMLLEIEVVSNRKVKDHPDLLRHKQKLAMDYRANVKSIAAQPGLMKGLSQDAKDVIREMAKKLAEVADRNARILRAAVGATQQLIQNIVTMVRTEVMPRQSYKNPAKAHLQLGTYSPTCQPVAISRSV